ncbi:MAG: SpoIIE family protein phosphatase [Bdellovibrionaceae bacterium]|nr:SpoIIE family protein phosphatase [Pseudobdellovibrionaceae bacterium]
MSQSEDELRRECEILRAQLVQKTHVIEVFKAELEKTNEVLVGLKKKLQNDYKALTSLFRFIVPTKNPQITGFEFSTQYKPGSQVNGDYFDIFEHKDKLKFGTMMSRSQSPSSSAVVLGLILKMGRELDHMQTHHPSDTLSHLVSELSKDLKEMPDILLGYFDKRSYVYSYAFTGKMFGMVYSIQNSKWVDLFNGKKDLETHEVKLEGKDRVVLISEGFFQSPNSKGELLAHEDVMAVLANISPDSGPHDVRHELLYLLDQHLVGMPQAHDVTLVIFSPDEPVLRLA